MRVSIQYDSYTSPMVNGTKRGSGRASAAVVACLRSGTLDHCVSRSLYAFRQRHTVAVHGCPSDYSLIPSSTATATSIATASVAIAAISASALISST